ncbi:MAG: hypothetical protein GY858_08815 [Candidatus Omnitrophica bacterium]|nr:hypothetical protein [Candidatus Omnitrophota bacterium]
MKKILLLGLIAVLTGCAAQKQPIIYQTAQLNQKEYPKVGDGKWISADTRKVWVGAHVDPDTGDYVAGHFRYIVLSDGHWDLQEEGSIKEEKKAETSLESKKDLTDGLNSLEKKLGKLISRRKSFEEKISRVETR